LEDTSVCSDLDFKHIQYNATGVLSPDIKRPGDEADSSPPSSAEVKNAASPLIQSRDEIMHEMEELVQTASLFITLIMGRCTKYRMPIDSHTLFLSDAS
jgi:hypothetical protein